MNANRLRPSRDPRPAEPSGSGLRRRSSQPAQPAVTPSVPPPPRRAASSTRQPALPSLDAPVVPQHDPELEARIFALVTAVAEDDGRTYPPEWSQVADAAKRRRYLKERGLRLYLMDHGKQWLSSRAEPVGGRHYTMTKINPATRLALKDLSRDTGVPMQEAIGHIISAVHEHRAELTSLAFKAGEKYPWEAIGVLLRSGRKA